MFQIDWQTISANLIVGLVVGIVSPIIVAQIPPIRSWIAAPNHPWRVAVLIAVPAAIASSLAINLLFNNPRYIVQEGMRNGNGPVVFMDSSTPDKYIRLVGDAGGNTVALQIGR